ncbi:MAG: glycosyl hydrolase family 2, partial [Terriglobales bacterium]
MGLSGKVMLRASGPVEERTPWVETHLESPSGKLAHLTVRATLVNATDREQSGTLRGSVAGLGFSRAVTLAPHASEDVAIPRLTLRQPRLWWPYQMGTPALVPLHVMFVQRGRVSDRADKQVGLDEITATKTEGGAEQFWVNGRKVFIRGGGWTPEMMLRDGPSRWALDFDYVRNLNLNAVRLEGKLMDDAFFDLADRDGILVMAGWCCCDHWEEWSKWKDDEGVIADASLASQADRLRGHASVLVWLNGSDNPPPAEVERSYIEVLAKAHWPKPILSSASGKETTVTGESGVKMTGPYDYVPPVYWLAEPQLGGARGFNTETSPGAAIPPIESLRRFIPADHLWTGSGPGQGADDPYWNFHAGSGNFLNLHRYEAALAARYGPADTLRDFDWKSQAMAYEGERAMFEAFGRRQGEATGVIQWMLNNGWPSLIWHLYDFYLTPAGGYYGAQRANEPLHVQYSGYDRNVSVVDHRLQAASGLAVQARVYSLDGKSLYQRRVE